MKRATTSAVQTVGRMVAAVYRNGGVTRREAMISCDHDNLRQENQLGIGMRRSWHRGKNIHVVGSECYRIHRNGLKGTPADTASVSSRICLDNVHVL